MDDEDAGTLPSTEAWDFGDPTPAATAAAPKAVRATASIAARTTPAPRCPSCPSRCCCSWSSEAVSQVGGEGESDPLGFFLTVLASPELDEDELLLLSFDEILLWRRKGGFSRDSLLWRLFCLSKLWRLRDAGSVSVLFATLSIREVGLLTLGRQSQSPMPLPIPDIATGDISPAHSPALFSSLLRGTSSAGGGF